MYGHTTNDRERKRDVNFCKYKWGCECAHNTINKWRSEDTLGCQPSLSALLEAGSVLAFATVCTRLGWPALKLVSRDSPISASPLPTGAPGLQRLCHNHAWFYKSWWRVKLRSFRLHKHFTNRAISPAPSWGFECQ